MAALNRLLALLKSPSSPCLRLASSGRLATPLKAATSCERNSNSLQRQSGFIISLSDGILTDQNGRTGYIASNYQFQFDKPPQAGAIYTAGFSVCNNGSLALGGEAVWWECLSGSFYNLYDRDWAPHCLPILIEVIGASLGSATTEITTTEASTAQAGTTNVIVTITSQNTNTGIIVSGGSTTATPLSESSNQAIVPATPSLPASGATASGTIVTGSGASATGGLGNGTSSTVLFSNSSTAHVTSSLATTTGSKASSSSASAKSTSSSGVAVPFRAQDALTGLGAAILGLALL